MKNSVGAAQHFLTEFDKRRVGLFQNIFFHNGVVVGVDNVNAFFGNEQAVTLFAEFARLNLIHDGLNVNGSQYH